MLCQGLRRCIVGIYNAASAPMPQVLTTVISAAEILRSTWVQARCLTAAEAGLRLAPDSVDPASVAEQARRADQLLASSDGERDYYPDFQWNAAGQLHARLSDLLAVLPRERDGSLGADAVLWMYAPDLALDGREPAALFGTHPDRVISLARRRRDGADNVD